MPGLSSQGAIRDQADLHMEPVRNTDVTSSHVHGDQLAQIDRQAQPSDGLPLTVYWEWEQGESQLADVQSRLKKCLSFWEEMLDPAPWIISCIVEGYKLLLRAIPNWHSRPNQQSALECLCLNPFKSWRKTDA